MTIKENEVLNEMSKVKQAARYIIHMMEKYETIIFSEHLHSSSNPLKYIKEKWNEGAWKEFSEQAETLRRFQNLASNKYFETFPNYWKGKDYLEINKREAENPQSEIIIKNNKNDNDEAIKLW